MTTDEQVKESLESREVFDKKVYLSLQEALIELRKRQDDDRLRAYVMDQVKGNIPVPMHDYKNFVLFRHLATANYETHRFAMVADAYPEFRPLIFEYTEDTFNDINEYKHHLGRLRFYKGRNRNNEPIVEGLTVVDFANSNKRPLGSINTLWGETLVNLHHRLFERHLPSLKGAAHDLSRWLRTAGVNAQQYYKPFLSLFLQNGILFENFLPYGKEFEFTRKVVLPALTEISNESGKRPLIVALEPTLQESDNFWLFHPHMLKNVVEETGHCE